MGAQKSRLAKAGGNYDAARQQLQSEIDSGAAHLSGDQAAFYQRDPEGFFAKYLNQSTKGKYSGVLGKVAKVAKVAAPIAAAFVPGIGPLAAAGLAAGAKAGGDVLAGEKFDLGGTLAAGVGGYAGNTLTGGQGYKAITGGGSSVAPVTAVAGSGGGGGPNILSRVGDWITEDPLRAAQLGLGAVNAVQGQQAASKANRLRSQSLARLNTPQREDLSTLFADEGNPYSRSSPGTAKRAAVRALAGGSY